MEAGARAVALKLLQRFDSGAWPNLLLPKYLDDLSPRDRAFAAELTLGATRRLGTLDWVASLFLRHKLETLDSSVRAAVRIGIYQLLYMSVPDFAAVDATVDLIGRGRSLVNATLRTVVRERDNIPWPLFESDPAGHISKVCSFPHWMAMLFINEIGPEAALEFAKFSNLPRPTIVRVQNHDDVADLSSAADLTLRPTAFARDTYVASAGGRPSTWPGFEEGKFAIADESSVLVGEVVLSLNPKVVADVCAGPGGKATHIATAARVVATDINQARAGLTNKAAQRLRVTGQCLVAVADAQTPVAKDADVILIDAPCSGLGVISRRPDLRWRASLERINELSALQSRLLNVAATTKSERIVYSVCTLTAAETTHVVDRFLNRNPKWKLERVLPEIPRGGANTEWIQLAGHTHGTDGMFIACFAR